LRQAIGDLVEIAFVGAEDVLGDREPRGLIKAASQHRDVGVVAVLPEQRRTAGRAEAAAGDIGGVVPGDGVPALNLDVVVVDIGGGVMEPGLPPALRAMAGDHLTQRAMGSECDRAAIAASGADLGVGHRTSVTRVGGDQSTGGSCHSTDICDMGGRGFTPSVRGPYAHAGCGSGCSPHRRRPRPPSPG